MSIETFAYPAVLERQEDGAILVRFPDFPEALTEGADEADALAEAADALEEAVASRLAHGEAIPEPSPRRGCALVPVPALTAAKAALHLAMAEAGTSKAALARRLGCDEAEIRRILNPRHATKIARLEDALAACGARLETRLVRRERGSVPDAA